jgi:Fic family protein
MQINSQEINLINTSSLDIFLPNHELNLILAKKDKIDFIYNTSALEGNAMTYPEVQTLLEGVTVGGHKLSDSEQILNQNRSVNLLFDMIDKDIFLLDKKTWLTLHEKVAYEEALLWGQFRECDVHIGGTVYQPPKAEKLDAIFNAGIDEIEKIKHPIIRAISCFLFGAKTQFFYDGNKRTARLMMNGILLKHGYPLLNIKAKDKLAFNQEMIRFYDGDDISKSIIFLMEYYVRSNRDLL